jgi:formylglycine-generating enzyme
MLPDYRINDSWGDGCGEVTAVPRTMARMQWIPGGTFSMGSERFYREEAPVHAVRVDGFWIDRTPVTNWEFAAFVSATGYKTLAEQDPLPSDYPDVDPALLTAGSAVFKSPVPGMQANPSQNWWHYIAGAYWRKPDGVHTLTTWHMSHPVVHIAFADAKAYAAWKGKDLPTEAEWEFAARGGLDGADYAWGDEFQPDGQRLANTWPGNFPFISRVGDHRYGTSAVGSFAPNGYDLLDMIGNVWEWTVSDWSSDHTAKRVMSCCSSVSASSKKGHVPRAACCPSQIREKVLKGGSHLCAENYCRRYRPAARHAQMTDSPTSHIGFRCVYHGVNPPY